MNKKPKGRKPRGVNVEVSLRAHEILLKESVKHRPRLTIRAQINNFLNLPSQE
jgi:hypothetical protein